MDEGNTQQTPTPRRKTKKEQDESYSEYAQFWAKRMREGGSFSHTHIEKPVMYTKMKDLAPGKSVLCIGCGSGEECDVLHNMGASRVMGTDISDGLIEEARKGFPHLEFEVIAAEDHQNIPDESFDVIYSSLTMHYVKNWERTFMDYYRILKPGGTFLFSANHPIRRGMEMIRRPGSRVSSLLLGYSAEPDNLQVRIYGEYLNFFTKHDRFMKKIQVTFYNRPFAQMWREIKDAGFEIQDIVEPKSLTQNVPERFKGFSKITQKIPYFIIFELVKPVA